MKGFSVIIDNSNGKKYLQIDIDELVKNPQKFEDKIDIFIAEERKNEKSISRGKVKKRL